MKFKLKSIWEITMGDVIDIVAVACGVMFTAGFVSLITTGGNSGAILLCTAEGGCAALCVFHDVVDRINRRNARREHLDMFN